MSLTQPTISRRSAGRVETAPPGAPPGRGNNPATPEIPQAGKVRPFLRRWLTAGMLLGAALIAVLYISNAIAVNELMGTIDSLEQEQDLVRRENEKLRAELLRLMSVERVTTLAAERLGMVQPSRPPLALTPAARMEAATAAGSGGTQ